MRRFYSKLLARAINYLVVPPLSYGLLHQGEVFESVVNADAVFVDDAKSGRDSAAVTLPAKILASVNESRASGMRRK